MNTIIFWNVAKNDNAKLISSLCSENRPDILILAEIGVPESLKILHSINMESENVFYESNPLGERVKIFSIFNGEMIIPVADSAHFSAVIVSPPLGPRYLLVGLHLISKLHFSDAEQSVVAQRVAKKIFDLESLHSIQETVVVGDFNMNPFEHGLVNCDGFHAIMDRAVCEKRSRTVQGEMRNFFYNPMWSLHGGAGVGPSGSYFYSASSPMCYFWNIFDQAIFRPNLIPFLGRNPVAILDKIKEASLLFKNKPNKNISDHLPIKIVFKSNNEV